MYCRFYIGSVCQKGAAHANKAYESYFYTVYHSGYDKLLTKNKKASRRIVGLPFCYVDFLSQSNPQVPSAQLYWDIYSPRNSGFPVFK